MHKNSDEATSFIAVATYESEAGTSRQTASFPPDATIRDVFTAFFTNPENGRKLFVKPPFSLELMPDHLTIPRTSEAGRWDVGELLGEVTEDKAETP